ncbi:CLUMA_CG018486, isoform A [Clunio marinus]|uniref:CLUMA_CG018486, isoform A n=1 Tax=Clunio marinus TaxID=568069 RepID=A0A1J1IZK3_9DIPT|nr:CLUMA_CG018486, isoform A [Clunio marinus]
MIFNFIFYFFSSIALVQGSRNAICEFFYSSPTVFLREGPFKDFICNYFCADIECLSPPNENCQIVDVPGKCCPAYNCRCEFNGQTFEDGEDIPDDNFCQQCTCSNGEKLCETIECVGPPSDNCEPVEVDGLCCPDYHCNIHCGFIGERYRNGQLLPNSCEGILVEEGQCCVRGMTNQDEARIPENIATNILIAVMGYILLNGLIAIVLASNLYADASEFLSSDVPR